MRDLTRNAFETWGNPGNSSNPLEINETECYTVGMNVKKELDALQLNNEGAEAVDDAVKEAYDLTDWEASVLRAFRFSLQGELSQLKFNPGFKLSAKRREIDCIVIDKIEKMPANKITQVTKVDRTRLT